MAIFAATLEGKATSEEIDAVEGLPPSKFPHELMIKLGFSPPGTPPRPPAGSSRCEISCTTARAHPRLRQTESLAKWLVEALIALPRMKAHWRSGEQRRLP
jgi:hypothetical protein